MRNITRALSLAVLVAASIVAFNGMARHAVAADDPKIDLPQITPEELVKILKSSGEKPVLFQVGFHVLYAQAHIPGSEYVGPTSTTAGLEQFQKRVESLPRNKFIVLYCGCCPWIHCPNVKPAYEQLRTKGFSKVKVLYIANNFGTDWVDKGYPVTKGD